jgi:hypothetical protein
MKRPPGEGGLFVFRSLGKIGPTSWLNRLRYFLVPSWAGLAGAAVVELVDAWVPDLKILKNVVLKLSLNCLLFKKLSLMLASKACCWK